MVPLVWLAVVLGSPHVRLEAAPPSAPTGSYELRHAGDAGCWLQVAPVARDTVRVQLQCSRGAPSFNMGFLDERLALRGSSVRYTTRKFQGECHIDITFAGSSATVTQAGSDAACGFGFGV